MTIIVEDYLHGFGIYPKTSYTKDKFVPCATKAFTFTKAEGAIMFDFFADNADTIPGSDVVAAIQKFRKTKQQATSSEPAETSTQKPKLEQEPAKPIKKTEKLSKEQEEALIKKFKATISKRNLDFMHLFSLADQDDSGVVSVIGLKNAIQTMIPDFASTDLFALLKILDKNKNGSIETEEYQAIMLTDKADLKSIADSDSRIDLRKSQMGSERTIGSPKSVLSRSAQSVRSVKPPASKPQPPQKPTTQKQSIAQVLSELVKKLQQKEIEPANLFDWTDTDKAGFLPTMRLYKELLVTVDMDKQKLAAAVKHMDLDSTGVVLRGDFLNFTSPSRNLQDNDFVSEKVQGDEAINIGHKIGDLKNKVMDDSFTKDKDDKKAEKQSKTSAAFKIKGSNKNIVVPPKLPDSIKNSVLGSGTISPKIKFSRKLDDAEFKKATKELKDQLMKNSISAPALFDDICIKDDVPEEAGKEKVATIRLFEALSKLLPTFDKFKLRAILHYIDVEKSGIISREEFDLVFNVNPDTGALEESQMSTVADADKGGNADKMMQDIDAMYKELNRIHMYDTFFKDCDTNGDGVVNILDIKSALNLRLDEDHRDMIVPFIKHVKRLFKTDFIDERTLAKLFSQKFKSITDLREYRSVLLRLRDMANDESKRLEMRQVSSANPDPEEVRQ